MRVVVRLFAGLAEAAGARTITLDLPEGATADAARRAIADRFPTTAAACERVALAVNAEYAPAEQTLPDGDEVALIPPVSGG
jgi:molybdopterin converting factor subunit 1